MSAFFTTSATRVFSQGGVAKDCHKAFVWGRVGVGGAFVWGRAGMEGALARSCAEEDAIHPFNTRSNKGEQVWTRRPLSIRTRMSIINSRIRLYVKTPFQIRFSQMGD